MGGLGLMNSNNTNKYQQKVSTLNLTKWIKNTVIEKDQSFHPSACFKFKKLNRRKGSE